MVLSNIINIPSSAASTMTAVITTGLNSLKRKRREFDTKKKQAHRRQQLIQRYKPQRLTLLSTIRRSLKQTNRVRQVHPVHPSVPKARAEIRRELSKLQFQSLLVQQEQSQCSPSSCVEQQLTLYSDGNSNNNIDNATNNTMNHDNDELDFGGGSSSSEEWETTPSEAREVESQKKKKKKKKKRRTRRGNTLPEGVTKRANGTYTVRTPYQGSTRHIGTCQTVDQATLAIEIARSMLKKDKGLKLSAEECERNLKQAKEAAMAGVLTNDSNKKKEGGTATPQDDDIIVGSDSSRVARALTESLSGAIASRVEAYSTAEGDAAKEAVAKECIESLGSNIRFLEKYRSDDSYTVLNEKERISYVLRIFNVRVRSRKNGLVFRQNNSEKINEKRREKTRIARAAESSDTAKMMRQLSEEYNARVAEGEDSIRAEDLLEPLIEVEIGKNKRDLPVVHYKTPTADDPSRVDDADVLTRLGIGKGNKWVKPARIHATHVPLEKMQLTDNKMMVVSNEMITKQTQTSCDLRMFGKWNHSKHSKWYNGIGMKNSIKFILRHWKNCWRDGELVELYLHVYFSTNKVYDSCFQVQGNNGNINPGCALLSGSIIMGEACAVIKATLGEDRRTLSDTTFKFIRINRDMKTVVDLPLDDKSLIVTPYEVTTKPSEEVNEGAVAWDASRESEAEDLTEEEIWERYEREHTDAYFNQP